MSALLERPVSMPRAATQPLMWDWRSELAELHRELDALEAKLGR